MCVESFVESMARLQNQIEFSKFVECNGRGDAPIGRALFSLGFCFILETHANDLAI